MVLEREYGSGRLTTGGGFGGVLVEEIIDGRELGISARDGR
jgi:hypothetical protein